MKSLLLTVEDGISSSVWLLHAKAYLDAGRTVLAITDTANVRDAVGMSESAPSYGQELTRHTAFSNRKVSREQAEQLKQELRALGPDVVVMWNMSPFQWAEQDPRWLSVLDVCADGPQDMVFVHYPYGPGWNYADSSVPVAANELLARIRWDYVAGGDLRTARNLRMLERLFPNLSEGLSAVPVEGCSPQGKGWQLATAVSGSRVVVRWAHCNDYRRLPSALGPQLTVRRNSALPTDRTGRGPRSERVGRDGGLEAKPSRLSAGECPPFRSDALAPGCTA